MLCDNGGDYDEDDKCNFNKCVNIVYLYGMYVRLNEKAIYYA